MTPREANADLLAEITALRDRLASLTREKTQADAQATEALEQKTATAEILRVISSSLTDVHPVFDAIASRVVRLCDGFFSTVWRYDGTLIHHAADNYPTEEMRAILTKGYPAPAQQGSVVAQAISEGRIIHVEDLLDHSAPPASRGVAIALGYRTLLCVPMLRDGVSIGAIAVARQEARPFSDRQIELVQTFADQAVIAVENVRLFNETKEALEQQTATSEILRVISSSPTDVQPVFTAMATSAARLCEAFDATIFRIDGDVLRLVAHEGPIAPDTVLPLKDGTLGGRVIRQRRAIHVADMQAETHDYPISREVARSRGFRTILSVPLLHGAEAIGLIAIRRTEVRPFTERQVELVKTFADQAVIAIDNVRLFTETKEALDRQTATSEILRVISSSPTDVQPVFDTIAASATRLCDGVYSVVFRYDGEVIAVAADNGRSAETSAIIRSAYPAPPGRGTLAGRALLERRLIAMTNAQDSRENPDGAERARALGYRAGLSVPMMRGDIAIGVINVLRVEATPFTDTQIQLLQTFADQAVIAIENVRLFNETKEALEQQTATSEVLRVISSSPTDVQPVFDTIVKNARSLCQAAFATLHRFDGQRLTFEAQYGMHEAQIERARQAFPQPTGRHMAVGRAVLDRRVAHIHDIHEDPEYHVLAHQDDYRTVLAVPLVREGVPVGALGLWRRDVRPFTDQQIELVKTFADQAVIAVENVRLFTELQEKNRALTQAHAQVTESLEQQTATAEILRVIASSPTDIQPVFDAVAESAARLCEAGDVSVFRREGYRLVFVAHHGPIAQRHGDFSLPLVRGTVGGRSVLESRTVQVADLQNEDREFLPEAVENARRFGFRTILSVPLLREGIAIGGIQLRRTEVQLFSERQIALLQTFADQAVIAIENVRLFKELETSNLNLTTALDQQTATSELLKVIGRSTFDLQPVFETLAENAVRLCEADRALVYRFDGRLLRLVVAHNASAELRAFIERNPFGPGRQSCAARTALERRTIHIHDAQADPDYTYGSRQVDPFRTIMGIPMLRVNELLGVIIIYRHEVRPFTDSQIALLETFADQAAIAIENARLLSELQARTQDLTRSVGQLTALGEVGRAVSSTLDLETVLSTIVSRAIQLSGTDGGSVYEYDEATEEFSLRASRDLPDAYVERVRDTRPRKGEGAVGRVAQTREPVQIVDIADATAYESRVRNILLQMGLRALLAVPLIAEDQLVGALIVMRKRTGAFAAEEVTLLQTFATQSALAIQNARLFREIEDKSRQLEVASQHKSEFLANMSHELRTPLNAIIGFSEVLSERMFGELNEKQEEYSKDIHASGQHLLSLINDILDLSKIEAGRMELELTDFHLPTALDSALTLVRERAGRRGIALHLSVDKRLGQIQADERKVRQIVLNLLSNAIKFTPEGGRIEVGAVLKDGSVEVSVSDTGVGIAPEDQEAVFEEFRQVGTADKKVEGTGLGLTLCRKFVELHGGKIWVKSQIGAGSMFTFTIPVRHRE